MIGAVLLALGLVFVIEGLAYVLAPSLIERILEAFAQMPVAARRIFGVLIMVSGLILIWLANYLGVSISSPL